MLGKHADHRHRHRLMLLQNHPGIESKLPVPDFAAQQDAEVHPRRQALALAHPHRLKADVVRIRHHGDPPAVIDRHVKLARQAK